MTGLFDLHIGDTFTVFWTRYPRKVGKGAAARSWMKLGNAGEDLDAILDQCERQCAIWATWTERDRRFIPHPATWLNQRRFEDDLQPLGDEHPSRDGTPGEVTTW